MEPLRSPGLELVVPGQAAGSGSKSPMPKGRMVGGRFRAVFDKVGRPVFYVKPASELTEPWMKKVREAAEAHLVPSMVEPLDGALWLDAAFYEMRPSTHFHSDGRRLRADAPAWPHQTSTHDIDKMRRAISDSLTNAKVLADDKRIVAGGAWKYYADEPPRKACAVIRVGRMLHQTVEDAEIESPPPPGQEQLT